MTDLQVSQLAVALFVAVTPWCVVRIALMVATRHARSVNASLARLMTLRWMNRATAVALVAAAAAGVWFKPPSLAMAAVDWALFAGLALMALRTLSELAEAARPSGGGDRLGEGGEPAAAATVPNSVGGVGMEGDRWRQATPGHTFRWTTAATQAVCSLSNRSSS
jgi:hypothetical protein